MRKLQLAVKSSYTLGRATIVGALVGLILFFFFAESSTIKVFVQYLLGSALISNVVWKCLSLMDRFLAPKFSTSSLAAFLIEYGSASFVVGTLATLLGLYITGLFFHIRLLADLRSMLFFIFIVMLMTTLVSSINFAQAFYNQALEVESARQLAAKAELKALKAQINPHFLFNSLNTIVQLVKVDPERAEAMILNLSHVFRYALQALEHEMVSLAEELDFVRAYLAIEQMRFEDALQITINIPEELMSVRLPPLLLQPLVENSIRHGITPKLEGGRIEIVARLQDGKLTLVVKDDGVGFDRDEVLGKGSSGIGLKNVQERLMAVYGPESRLCVESQHGEGTRICFHIPAEMKPSAVGHTPPPVGGSGQSRWGTSAERHD